MLVFIFLLYNNLRQNLTEMVIFNISLFFFKIEFGEGGREKH